MMTPREAALADAVFANVLLEVRNELSERRALMPRRSKGLALLSDARNGLTERGHGTAAGQRKRLKFAR